MQMSNSLIPTSVLERLNLVGEFQHNLSEMDEEAHSMRLVNDYAPRVLTSFNINWNLPADHLATGKYRDVLTIPAGKIPVFTAPDINNLFPGGNADNIDPLVHASLLPILIPAQAVGEDFRQFRCQRTEFAEKNWHERRSVYNWSNPSWGNIVPQTL